MSLKGECLELLVQADMNNEHGECNFGLWQGLIEWMKDPAWLDSKLKSTKIPYVETPAHVATTFCCSPRARTKPQRWQPSPWPQKCSRIAQGMWQRGKKSTPGHKIQIVSYWDFQLKRLPSMNLNWSVSGFNALADQCMHSIPYWMCPDCSMRWKKKDKIPAADCQMCLLTLSRICHFQRQIKLPS